MSVDLGRSRTAFTTAIRQGDEAAAGAIVDELRAAGVPPSDIYFEIFAPSMVMIGELWEQNEISVAEEHLATAITERLIGQLSPLFSQPAAQGARGSVVLGCVAGEQHVLALRMLADLFRQQGWRVLYLGPDVPTADFVRLAVRFNANLVAISAGSERLVPETRTLIGEIRAALPHVVVITGGSPFQRDPGLWKTVGASSYHPDPHTAVTIATAQYAVDAAQRAQ